MKKSYKPKIVSFMLCSFMVSIFIVFQTKASSIGNYYLIHFKPNAIYLKNIEKSLTKKIFSTTFSKDLNYIKISPSGEKIALIVDDEVNSLYVMDLKNYKQTKISSETLDLIENNFNWSSDGSEIAFFAKFKYDDFNMKPSSDLSLHLFKTNVIKNEVTDLGRYEYLDLFGVNYWGPHWCCNDKKIIFYNIEKERLKVHCFDIFKNNREDISVDASSLIEQSLSPDKKECAFITYYVLSKKYILYHFDIENNKFSEIAQSKYGLSNIKWFSDSKRFIFTANQEPTYNDTDVVYICSCTRTNIETINIKNIPKRFKKISQIMISPEERFVYFIAQLGNDYSDGIIRINLENSQSEEVVEFDNIELFDISPLNDSITFIGSKYNNFKNSKKSIYLKKFSEKKILQISPNYLEITLLKWTPVNNYILFETTNDNLNFNLNLLNLESKHIRKVGSNIYFTGFISGKVIENTLNEDSTKIFSDYKFMIFMLVIITFVLFTILVLMILNYRKNKAYE